jgi:hypothetical protein
MDLNELRKVGRHLEAKRRQRLPEGLRIEVQFPFEIHKAKWTVVESHNGSQQLVQQRMHGKDGLFGFGEPVNPWQVRKEFLALRTNSAALKFLNRYGQWDDSNDPETLDEFWGFREEYELLMDFPDAHRRVAQQLFWKRKFTCSLRWNAPTREDNGNKRRRATAAWVVECRTIMDALIGSIQIDLVRRVKDRLCKRPDCRHRFVPQTSRQKHCTPYCAHLVSVRRNRRIANAKKWHKQGMSLTQIARRLRSNRNTVKKMLDAKPRIAKAKQVGRSGIYGA